MLFYSEIFEAFDEDIRMLKKLKSKKSR